MINPPSKPKIIKLEENQGVFEIENLHPGYGITIGNSLRRILLSSLKGAAVTFVKIKGATHEFSTLPNVLEDIIEITLNLKQLRFKLYGDESQKIYLKIKGEKEVKGKDFETPSQVEVMNKDLHIATLTSKNAELEMELTVEPGIGYVPTEERHQDKLEIGTIALDAIFTPIRKVNFEIENMRVKDRTDFNRLRIYIDTDGTISPDDAFESAVNILKNQITHLSLLDEKEIETTNNEESQDKTNQPSKIKIKDLDLSPRIIESLESANIKTVSALLKKKEDELLKIEGFGKKALEEIRKELKKINLILN